MVGHVTKRTKGRYDTVDRPVKKAARLIGYINPQLAISLAQSYVFPDKVAWTAGTRTVICEVHAVSGQLTGSVRSVISLPGAS